jgi:hypothetical protein
MYPKKGVVIFEKVKDLIERGSIRWRAEDAGLDEAGEHWRNIRGDFVVFVWIFQNIFDFCSSFALEGCTFGKDFEQKDPKRINI